MALTPEGKVKARVKKILQESGAWWYMPIGTGIGSRNGVPDFLCCYRGVLVGIETKAGRNKATALQMLELRNIYKAGGCALIVNETNIEDVTKALGAVDTKERYTNIPTLKEVEHGNV